MSHSSKQKNRTNLQKRKRGIEKRLIRKQWEDQPKPIMTASNIHYEIGAKTEAISCGGIGVIHQMVKKIGLGDAIDKDLNLLKFHVPHHESDHVFNIAYNVMVGGVRLEDIELRRNDEVFLNALGAERIPDPTTAGDFTRRFDTDSIEQLMEAINRCRQQVWRKRGNGLLDDALIDIDGSIAKTYAECKEGMDLSYKGIWGYHPLIISPANTKEVLYLVNRPANVPSHSGAADWINKAIELVLPHAKRACLRGDTDFSLTRHFDRWSESVDFVFGMDACKGLIRRAEEVPPEDWRPMMRKPKYVAKGCERERPENIKEQIVVERNFKNICLDGEDIAEFSYRPSRCMKSYRMIVLRKNLSVKKGEAVLFDDIRYFFYITTRKELSARQVVELANGRCDQENVIEQLKNGVNALRMPVDNLLSNWAYMVIAALVWNLKAWFGLMMHYRNRGIQIIKMEFRQFLNQIILIPCQIIRQGRKLIYRVLGYNTWVKDLLTTWGRIRNLQFMQPYKPGKNGRPVQTQSKCA